MAYFSAPDNSRKHWSPEWRKQNCQHQFKTMRNSLKRTQLCLYEPDHVPTLSLCLLLFFFSLIGSVFLFSVFEIALRHRWRLPFDVTYFFTHVTILPWHYSDHAHSHSVALIPRNSRFSPFQRVFFSISPKINISVGAVPCMELIEFLSTQWFSPQRAARIKYLTTEFLFRGKIFCFHQNRISKHPGFIQNFHSIYEGIDFSAFFCELSWIQFYQSAELKVCLVSIINYRIQWFPYKVVASTYSNGKWEEKNVGF